jgi:hypothetical protein
MRKILDPLFFILDRFEQKNRRPTNYGSTSSGSTTLVTSKQLMAYLQIVKAQQFKRTRMPFFTTKLSEPRKEREDDILPLSSDPPC